VPSQTLLETHAPFAPALPQESGLLSCVGAGGAADLSDGELVALFLRLPLAAAEGLLASHGSLACALWAAAALPAHEADRPSAGFMAAALREAARRLAQAPLRQRCVISSWTALLAYSRTTLGGRPREQFRVLFLDKKNQLIADEVMGEGTVDHAPVYPREVVRRALELAASALILLHNHPSGDPTPSTADVEMTRRVVEAARALDLVVHDHLVVGDTTVSLKALGLM
jgi:DNA repair protein RadC